MNHKPQTFYSNGKLLITGEYVVLDGAEAFALPTKFGQDLVVAAGEGKVVAWKSLDSDGSVWFAESMSFDEIANKSYIQKSDSIRSTLLEILHEAYIARPEFIEQSDGYEITTHLTFPKFWGLGTSSTLINNIAQWLKIDAFELLQNSFGGSGYDIACAQNNSPILYRRQDSAPIVQPISFNPQFAGNLYFVYLNRKQSSKAAIASYYYHRHENLSQKIERLNKITSLVVNATDHYSFARALEQHEAILSDIIEMKTVKEAFFSDFTGAVKSLGGWGGDFVLAVSDENPQEYFKERGFETIVPYSKMIL
ncbi:MAG TPA: GYDIA family GHMP kinase [Flavobacterium sp.]|jgi:mevalonate kinase